MTTAQTPWYRFAPSRARLKAREAADRLGLSYAAKGDKRLAKAFGHLSAVRGSSLSHIMTGVLDGRAITAFQTSQIVMAGTVPIQVAHMVYAVEAPQWPATAIVPRGWLSRALLRLGQSPSLALEDPRFNLWFKLKASDEDFAITLLTPAMQQFMLDKLSVRWRIGHGWVTLVYSGTFKPDRLDVSLDRSASFWTHVEPELIDRWP